MVLGVFLEMVTEALHVHSGLDLVQAVIPVQAQITVIIVFRVEDHNPYQVNSN